MPAPPDLQSAIVAFLEDIAGAGSPKSVMTYRAALGRFTDYLDEQLRRQRKLPIRKPRKAGEHASPGAEPQILPALAELTVQDAVDFARWLETYFERERGRAPSQATLFTYTAALQSFYAYLHREAIRPDLDLEALRQRLKKLRGRRDRALPRVPDDEVVEALCRVARAVAPADRPRAELIRLRDIALLECLRSSGLRVSEAVSLRREHFNLADPSAVVRGKGGKDRVVFFSARAIEALQAYWRARADERVTRHTGSLPAFARHSGPATGKVLGLTTQGVRYIVERLRQRAGAEWPVTPHRLRAWFATHLLDSEVNLAEVQDLMGHESANTTRIYTKVHPRRLQEAHRRAFDALGS